MFNPPSLAETIRVTNNRMKYARETNQPYGDINWLAADQQLGGGQPQPSAPEPGSGIPVLPGTNPMMAFNGYKPRAAPVGMGGDAAYNWTHPQLPKGQFYDPQTDTPVIGVADTPAAKTAYLSGTKNAGNTWSHNAIGADGGFYGGGGGTFGMAGKPSGPADPWKRDTRRKNEFAEGGTIVGPGGPRSDSIPAVVDGVRPIAVSNGEEIVDAATREWFGKKFFVDLKEKAEKAMGEHETAKQERGEMPGHRGAGPSMPGYKDGGTASPWVEMQPWNMAKTVADDAVARDSLHTDLANAKRFFDAQGQVDKEQMIARSASAASIARTEKELEALRARAPEAEARAAAVDARAQAALALPMEPGAPAVGFANMNPAPAAAAPGVTPAFERPILQTAMAGPYGSGSSVRPAPQAPAQAAPLPTFFHPAAPGTAAVAAAPTMEQSGFRAPWEQRAEEAAAREAAAPSFPGMNRTESRRFAASPQGAALLMAQAERAKERKAQAAALADERAFNLAHQGDAAAINNNYALARDSTAAAQRMQEQERERVQREGERTVDWQRNEAARNQAIGLDAKEREAARVAEQKQWEDRNAITSKQSGAAAAAAAAERERIYQEHFKQTQAAKGGDKGRIVMQGETPIMLHPDGSYEPAVNLKPTPAQKEDAYAAKYGTGKKPKTPEEWDEAYYLASGKSPAPAATAAPAKGAAAAAKAPAAPVSLQDRLKATAAALRGA